MNWRDQLEAFRDPFAEDHVQMAQEAFSPDLSERQFAQYRISRKIAMSLAQLVVVHQALLSYLETMTPKIVQALIDLVNSLSALVKSEAGDHQALLDAQKALADLQAQDAALNDPALVKAANDAIAAAAAAQMPPPEQPPQPAPEPVPAPVEPTPPAS